MNWAIYDGFNMILTEGAEEGGGVLNYACELDRI